MKTTSLIAMPRLFPALAASAASLVWAVAGTLAAPGQAHALACGANNGFVCQGTPSQYGGSFSPGVGYGGFGGGACTATKTR